MGLQDFFQWRSATTTPAVDEEVPADVDEPPDFQSAPKAQAIETVMHPDFHKSIIRPNNNRKESLLTKALHKSESEEERPTYTLNEMARRRSMLSNASMASTAELTSDGGLTSPARTNTPSPPPPSNYMRFASYTLAPKTTTTSEPHVAKLDSPDIAPISDVSEMTHEAPVEPKKRCISFACGGVAKPKSKPAPVVAPTPEPPIINAPAVKRPCKISFACAAPKPSTTTTEAEKEKSVKQTSPQPSQMLKPLNDTPRRSSRSPSAFKKSPRSQVVRSQRDSSSAARPASRSPVATRVKPRYIIADETTMDTEATRFHEFASDKVQEDDWIRRDEQNPKARLTISDTLKKENAIRQLGAEAEEEALEEEEEDDNEDEDDEDEDEDDEDGISDDEFSDGNETDNEAGFAESDDSDGEGEFDFWAPGRRFSNSNMDGASTYRPSAHRTASASSIDSLDHMSPINNGGQIRRSRKEHLQHRPGTPDLPDSTDFVCGTLDEDRPLEDAYKSCMEARKHAKHKQTPQDIDPSFPTSDIDDEEDDEDLVDTARSSDENVWMQGKFEEDSDGERVGRRGSRTARRKSPLHSPPPPRRLHSPPPPKRLHSPPPPKRLHSPPPAKRTHSPAVKSRLRSPPPRRLFGGHSPKRMQSPVPARHVASPAASPTSHNNTAMAIPFAPLGSRPGLTHTKSLPRAPNMFCRQYRAAQLAAANGNDGSDDNDGHKRGAIDIVKGLEQKRQRRKEKFHQKQAKGKGHVERRPQPGKGAERMRELGLLMAGKTGRNDPYILSA